MRKHRRRLAICNAIEEFHDLRGGFSRLMDRTRILQRVDAQRSGGVAHVVQLEIPSGFHDSMGLLDIQVAKSFVQPDVIPPLHGDEIAKPLMCHLVGNHAGNRLLQTAGAVLLVDLQKNLAESDASRIFHGAREKSEARSDQAFP